MLSFQNIEYLLGLLLLIPIVGLFVFVLKWKKKVKQQIGDEELVNALIADYSPKNYRTKFIFIAISIALCVVGAANLRKPAQGNTGNLTGVDVMVALDVSNSMLAQDVKPDRLERAKQVLSKIVDKLGSNRLGLVVFAGEAYLQMPLTSDLAAAKLYISNASTEAVPTQGTDIDKALTICNSSLDTKEKKYKAVILITDGETHDEKIENSIKLMQENGVVVHTIGIGSPQGAPIFDPVINDYKKDETGNTIISKLNEKDLQNLAAKTGGQYLLFSNADKVANALMEQIDGMEKKRVGGAGVKIYQSYFQWFLLAAFIALLIEVIIPERKMKWLQWSK